MRLWLKDLKPGDEFEYVETAHGYRRGKFLVLDRKGSYLQPAVRAGCVFIFSFLTNKVCQHWGLLDVILISKSENNMKSQKEMGHFTEWKFGIPVRIYEHNPGGYNYPEYEEARLVNEDDKYFIIVFNGGKMGMRSKRNFHYELIPHKYGHLNIFNPRYPVCQTEHYTAFCNANNKMATLDAGGSELKRYPAATLNIGGKTIELSAETTAELKKKLGV